MQRERDTEHQFHGTPAVKTCPEAEAPCPMPNPTRPKLLGTPIIKPGKIRVVRKAPE